MLKGCFDAAFERESLIY